MYEFIYIDKDEEIRVSTQKEYINIFELGRLFSDFLRGVGFTEASIRELFGLEEDEELPTG